jgi:hypothetical protein
MGVLATRSPHRPNPVGLSVAKVRIIEFKHHSFGCPCGLCNTMVQVSLCTLLLLSETQIEDTTVTMPIVNASWYTN